MGNSLHIITAVTKDIRTFRRNGAQFDRHRMPTLFEMGNTVRIALHIRAVLRTAAAKTPAGQTKPQIFMQVTIGAFCPHCLTINSSFLSEGGEERIPDVTVVDVGCNDVVCVQEVISSFQDCTVFCAAESNAATMASTTPLTFLCVYQVSNRIYCDT